MRAKDFLIESTKKCPLATQDININIKNRQKAINEQGYGPLNPLEPNEKFWAKKVQMWQLDDVGEAKKSLCGNCAAFDKSEETLKCIAQGIGLEDDPTSTIEAGDLGYCKFLKFKCASLRTCDAWVVGGPITEDQISKDKINEFLDFVKKYLGLDELPEINFLQTSLDNTFGHYGNGKIEVVVAGRHQNDVFRTLAHELVHYKQELDGRINDKSGETGSTEENEANSEAGVIMRHYNHSKENALEENFADGRNPQDKGDSRRHGIPNGATIAQLKKIRSSDTASPRKKQLAHWQINMRQGKKK